MCQEMLTTFGCRHQERRLIRCDQSRNFKKEKDVKKRKKNTLCGWLLGTKGKKSCKTQRYEQSIHSKCNTCLKIIELNIRENVARQQEQAGTAGPSHNAYEAGQRQREKRVKTFLCSKCRREQRNGVRTPEGFCCENGRVETSQQEWYHNPHNLPNTCTNIPRTATGFATQQRLCLRQKTSIEVAREQAKDVAKTYRWGPDSRSSMLLRDVGSMSSDLDSLQMPVFHNEQAGRAEQAELFYEEPGIDFDLWNRYPQTVHGRFPPPTSVPPRKPLPQKPLPARSQLQERASSSRNHAAYPLSSEVPNSIRHASPSSRHHESRPSFIEISPPTSSARLRNGRSPSPVSPLWGHFPYVPWRPPTPEPPEPPQPGQPLRSILSNLDYQIDEAMRFWTSEN